MRRGAAHPEVFTGFQKTQQLCLQAAVLFIGTPALVAFQASGKPAFVAKMSLIGLLVLAAVIYPLSSRFGVQGAVAALVIGALAPSPFIWVASIRLVGCSFTEWLKPIGMAVISTGVMVVAMIFIETYFIGQVEIVELVWLVGVGVLVYCVATLLIDRSAKHEIAAYLRATL